MYSIELKEGEWDLAQSLIELCNNGFDEDVNYFILTHDLSGFNFLSEIALNSFIINESSISENIEVAEKILNSGIKIKSVITQMRFDLLERTYQIVINN